MNNTYNDLLLKREELRKKGLFKESDEIRDELLAKGFAISDTKDGPLLIPQEIRSSYEQKTSYIVLFGSGETSSIGRSIHEYIFKKIDKKEIHITIISTPAGFQPNVETVEEEISDFFKEKLINFHPQISIIYANNKDDANNENVLKPLDSTDYIVIGPGSPTYAINNLKDTLLYKKVKEKIKTGTSLCLASASVIAFSHLALPVYEIFKVGSGLYWNEGLDLYKNFITPHLTIVPHFNNSEGGKKNDTSFCYMGKKRFDILKQQLPSQEQLWGIDENTALIWNIETKKVEVKGKGNVYTYLKKDSI